MNKLMLRIDELAVETFDTGKTADAIGTVQAHGAAATYPRDLCKTILTACPCTPRAEYP